MEGYGNCGASEETENRYEDHGHVYAKELLKIRWVCCYAGCEDTDGTLGVIEKGNAFCNDVSEIFFSICRYRALESGENGSLHFWMNYSQ